MRIALVIQKLSPAGGLEQHALRLASLLAGRGHQVTLITTRAPTQPLADGLALEVIAARGDTNHGRMAALAEDAHAAAAGRFERTAVFHPIPGFDVVFCANVSRARPGPLRALLPRYRHYAALEREAFAPPSRSVVLCLSSVQRDAIARNNQVPPERLVLLPPTVERSSVSPVTAEARATARDRLRLPVGAPVWLWMGLQAATKGLDRALAALVDAPAARLVVTGLDLAARPGAAARRRAERLGLADRVLWLGFCTAGQLQDAKAAANLLLHPAREDVTGTVILEAMAGGLPVITTAVCGYAEHVRLADAGLVLAEPYRAAELRRALAAATPERLAAWSANALVYTSRDDLFSGLDRAADAIEAVGPEFRTIVSK